MKLIDENTMLDGEDTYKAVAAKNDNDCEGCAFGPCGETDECSNHPGNCSAMYRNDGRAVIWVKLVAVQ